MYAAVAKPPVAHATHNAVFTRTATRNLLLRGAMLLFVGRAVADSGKHRKTPRRRGTSYPYSNEGVAG